MKVPYPDDANASDVEKLVHECVEVPSIYVLFLCTYSVASRVCWVLARDHRWYALPDDPFWFVQIKDLTVNT